MKQMSEGSNFSNESQNIDYTSLEGIRTRTGVDNDKSFGTFIIKESIDNALDFIEQNAKTFEELYKQTKQNPYVSVIISEEEDGKVTKIRIRNSNSDLDENVFTVEQCHKIFNINKYLSSKRHRYNIKRGALGDALKEIL